MAKQRKKSKKNEEVTVQYSIKGIIVLAVCVLVVFLGFYLFTLHMTKNEDNSSNTDIDNDEVTFSYDTILLGQSLSVRDGSYYVLMYDFKDEEKASTYSNLFTDYKSKEDAIPIYKVDMSNGFNKNYVTDGESNKTPTAVSEFAVNGATLIKIEDHNVVDYIEGEEGITNMLS